MTDEYVAPVVHNDAGLKDWNLDMRDMFLVRDRKELSVHYNDY